MDEPLVWIQKTPPARSVDDDTRQSRIYCTSAKYKDVTFQWCYVNVNQCTVEFEPLNRKIFDKKSTAWLVFNMGHDYHVYGPITVKGTSRGEEVKVTYHMRDLEDLDQQGHFCGRVSWGRIVPIRFQADVDKDVVISVTFAFTFRATAAHVKEKSKTCSLSFVFPLLGRQDKAKDKEEHYEEEISDSDLEQQESEEGFLVEMTCDMVQPGKEFSVKNLPTRDEKLFNTERHEFTGSKRVENGGRMEIKFVWEDSDVMNNYFLKPVEVEANGYVALSYPFCQAKLQKRSKMIHVVCMGDMERRPGPDLESIYGAVSQLLQRTSSDVVYVCARISKRLAGVKLQNTEGQERLSELQTWIENGHLMDRNIISDINSMLQNEQELQDTEVKLWIFCEGNLDEPPEGLMKEWKKYLIHVGHSNCDYEENHNMDRECVVPWGASISSDYQAILCEALQDPYVKSFKLETTHWLIAGDFPTIGCISCNEIAYNVFKVAGVSDESVEDKVMVEYGIGKSTESKGEPVHVISEPAYHDVLSRMFDHLCIMEQENELTKQKFSADWIKEREKHEADPDVWKTRDSLSRFVDLTLLEATDDTGSGFCVTPTARTNKFVLYQYAWWDTKDDIQVIARNIYGIVSSKEISKDDKRSRQQLNHWAYSNQTRAWHNTLSEFASKFPEHETANWPVKQLKYKLLKSLPAYWQPWYEATLKSLKPDQPPQDET